MILIRDTYETDAIVLDATKYHSETILIRLKGHVGRLGTMMRQLRTPRVMSVFGTC